MNIRSRRALGIVGACLLVAAVGCTDLTVQPKSTVTEANIFTDPNSYASFLGKIYGGLTLTGQQGPAGNADIVSNDEGFMSYTRLWWNLNELPSDEVHLSWNDAPVNELNTSTWAVSNGFVQAMYYRIYFQIVLVNEFLRQTTDAQLDGRGQTNPALRADVKSYRAEARYMRALSYWHALDLYGNVPLVTENNQVGSPAPAQVTRDSLYKYIVSELTAIIPDLPAWSIANNTRGNQAAAYMLLAKVHLNAEAYGLTPAYTQAYAALQNVLGTGGLALAPAYRNNFLADNNTSPEIIFGVQNDGVHTQSYGGVTFLVHASCHWNTGSAAGAGCGPLGLANGSGWAGYRIRPEGYDVYFPPNNVAGDTARAAVFHTANRTEALTTWNNYEDGYAVTKYSNVTSAGAPGSNDYFVDTDLPMFRLGDAYLMYAELFLRGGGGSQAQALTYINALRERSYGNTNGDITGAQLTLDFVMAERMRELLLEGHRRTDLIRFGKFTGGSYNWTWKNNVLAGAAIGIERALYPIPETELVANPNLCQNPGYGGRQCP